MIVVERILLHLFEDVEFALAVRTLLLVQQELHGRMHRTLLADPRLRDLHRAHAAEDQGGGAQANAIAGGHGGQANALKSGGQLVHGILSCLLHVVVLV